MTAYDHQLQCALNGACSIDKPRDYNLKLNVQQAVKETDQS